jgi:two-component system cell cycle sensor histidine kinase/response regulator CckA
VRGSGETDEVFAQAPLGIAVLDGADPASAALLDSNASLMEMTQGRATPSAAFADLFEASEGPQALALRLRQAMNDPIEITLATLPPTAVMPRMSSSGDAIASMSITASSWPGSQSMSTGSAVMGREFGPVARPFQAFRAHAISG